MERTDIDLKEFIGREDEKKQSALAKLKLLVYGVQDAPKIFSFYETSFKEEHYAYDNGNWGVNKNRLVPTEIILPGGIVSKLHIRPESPYMLVQDGDRMYVKDGKHFISEFKFLKRPKFWNYFTRNGTATKKIAQIYGLNALNINLFSGCEFQNVGKGCRFCAVNSTVQRNDPVDIIKRVSDIEDTCDLAAKNDDIKYILITGGSYLDRECELARNVEVIEAIRAKFNWGGILRGNISLLPPKDFRKLKVLHDCGVEHPSINMEAWPEENFKYICPGKYEYVGFKHMINSLLYLAEVYGSGEVWSNFVAGVVPAEDIKSGFRFMAKNGIVPGANLYHAEVESVIGKTKGTFDENFVLEIFRYVVELYYQYGYKPFFDKSVLRNSLTNEIYEGLL